MLNKIKNFIKRTQIFGTAVMLALAGAFWIYRADVRAFNMPDLYLDGVKQNGVEVTPEYDEDTRTYTFKLNDIQDYEILVHAEGGEDDAEYEVLGRVGWNKDIEVCVKDRQYNSTSCSDYKYGEKRIASHAYGDDVAVVKVEFYGDETLPRLNEANLKYADYDDEITYIVNPKLHNAGHPLAMEVKGAYYDEDEFYEVTVDVLRHLEIPEVGTKNEFTYTLPVSGADLNKGYTVKIENFTMDFMDTDEVVRDENEYEIKVTVGEAEKSWYGDYMYGEVKSLIVLPNGQRNAMAGGGGACGGHYCDEFIAMSETILTGDAKVTLYYLTYDYEDTSEYVYELYYGSQSNHGILNESHEQVKSGKITGAELNDGLLSFEIDNKKNYERPNYVLYIKKDGKIVNIVSDTLDLWSGEGLVSSTLTTTKEVYLQMGKFSYEIPEGTDVTLTLTGANFDDNTKYTVRVDAGGYLAGHDYDYTGDYYREIESISEEYEFSGKELNTGTAEVQIKYDEAVKELGLIGVSLNVVSEEKPYLPGNWFNLRYVEMEEILTTTGYKVDGASGMIKNIGKSTNISDFAAAVNAQGGDVKVYDANGETEQTGKIGTGMIVRVVDGYERPVMDIDAVVVGDVTGDGEITALDLARERQHLAEKRELAGAYKVAGSVSGVDEITATDLARMRQDIAGIREMK